MTTWLSKQHPSVIVAFILLSYSILGAVVLLCWEAMKWGWRKVLGIKITKEY